MVSDPKHTVKANQGFLKAKKSHTLQCPKKSLKFNPIQHAFSVTEDRKVHKQSAPEVGCSVSLEKCYQGVNLEFVDIDGLQTAASH